MPEAITWALFGAAATIICQRTFRWLQVHERPARPTEYEQAERAWKRMQVR